MLYKVWIELVSGDALLLEECVGSVVAEVCGLSKCVQRDYWCVAAIRTCLVKVKPLPASYQVSAAPAPATFAARLEVDCKDPEDAVNVVGVLFEITTKKCKGVGTLIH